MAQYAASHDTGNKGREVNTKIEATRTRGRRRLFNADQRLCNADTGTGTRLLKEQKFIIVTEADVWCVNCGKGRQLFLRLADNRYRVAKIHL